MAYRDDLAKIMSKEFDSKDKAYMFLRIKFPDMVNRINLEFSPDMRAFQILNEFERHCLINELEEALKELL